MPEISINGARLFYEEQGAGPETIVFSHSYLLTAEHFAPQVEALRDRYRCVSFDHRGHGRSERTRSGYEMENLYANPAYGEDRRMLEKALAEWRGEAPARNHLDINAPAIQADNVPKGIEHRPAIIEYTKKKMAN